MRGRRHMRRTGERGEGNFSTVVAFALLIAVGLACWNLIPVYYAHYDFTDKVEEICRMPRYKARTDEALMDMLMKDVRDHKLDAWITPQNFQIHTSDTYRTISVSYARDVKILPGWTRTFKFEYTSEQPLI
jgi:hypothetical protein